MWMYYSVKMHDTSPKNLLNNPGRENSRCIDHYSLCSPAGCGLTAAAHLFWSFFTLSFVIRPNEQFPSDRFCIFPSSQQQQQQQQIDKLKKICNRFPQRNISPILSSFARSVTRNYPPRLSILWSGRGEERLTGPRSDQTGGGRRASAAISVHKSQTDTADWHCTSV